MPRRGRGGRSMESWTPGSNRSTSRRRTQPELEKPPHPTYQRQFYALTQIPGKRKTSAYDDQISLIKRTKLDSSGQRVPAAGLGSPWEDQNELEKPEEPRTRQQLELRADGYGADKQIECHGVAAVANMGVFEKLPREIRDEIFRYLLLWPRDVPVFGRWDFVLPRQKPTLRLDLLRTCRAIAQQGTRILYGENLFTCHIRDHLAGNSFSSAVKEIVYANCHFPVDKYGNAIRHIRVNVDVRDTDKEALSRILYRWCLGSVYKSSIHTLTLRVQMRSNTQLSIYKYFMDNQVQDTLLKLRACFIRVIVVDSSSQCFERRIDLRDENCGGSPYKSEINDSHLQAAGQTNHRRLSSELSYLAYRFDILAKDPQRAVELGFFQPIVDNEAGDGDFDHLSRATSPAFSDLL